MSTTSIAYSQPAFDSRAEFSGTQGQDGWFYGYYDGDSESPFSPTDFEELPFFSGNVWSLEGPPNGFFTFLTATEGHPNGTVQGGNARRALHWVVRRWVSPTDQTLRVAVVLRKRDNSPNPRSNGIRGGIILRNNGESTFLQTARIGPQDVVGVEFELEVEISEGGSLDFFIDPYEENDLFDSTWFTATATVVANVPDAGVDAGAEDIADPDTGSDYPDVADSGPTDVHTGFSDATPSDASGSDLGKDLEEPNDDGCGCSSAEHVGESIWPAIAMLLALFVLRIRRKVSH